MTNKNYYSIISFVNNPLSKESIAIGMALISENNIFIKFSKTKVDFAKKLNKDISKLLDFSISKINSFANNDNISSSTLDLINKRNFNFDFLNRVAIYNNNIIQFSNPTFISKNFNEASFISFFEKYIGKDIIYEKTIQNSDFKLNIYNTYHEKLKNKINIDYNVKPGFLGTFFSDFSLDGIGVNGSFYAAKAIDFNTNKVKNIKDSISNFESFIVRLNNFAKAKSLGSNPKYYIISDPYDGNKLSYQQLYSIINNENQPFFKLIDSSSLKNEVNSLLASNIEKVTDRFVEFK